MSITNNREITVTFDEHLPSMVQPFVGIEKSSPMLAQSSVSEIDGVEHIPGVGWVLDNQQSNPGKIQERTDAQGGILGLASFTSPVTAVEFNTFKQSGLTGVTYDAGTQSEGSPFIQKRIGGSASFEANLSADQTAYPGPPIPIGSANMDRFLVSNINHEPSDELIFRVFIPGVPSGLLSLFTIYFCGPAGITKYTTNRGIGQYALTVFASGVAQLFEKGDENADTTWLPRKIFRFPGFSSSVPNASNGGTFYQLRIKTNCKDSDGYPGDKIAFMPLVIAATDSLNQLALLAKDYISAYSEGFIYDVPRYEELPPTLAPIRLDIRRDMRPMLQVIKVTYPETGTLYDDVISLPFYPSGTEPLYLYWWGKVPTGTSLTAEIYDADTGVKLSDETDIVIDEIGGIRTYTPNSKQRRYRVKISWESDGTQTKTPILESYSLARYAVFDTPSISSVESPAREAGAAFIKHTPSHVSINGPDADGSGSSANFTFHDMNEFVTLLEDKGGQPIKIETTNDALGNKSVLFRGYIDAAAGGKVTGGSGFGTGGRRKYTIGCSGEEARLRETLVPQRFTWFDKETNQGWKITDIIRRLLETAYPSDMVDVPDIEIRLFDVSGDYLLEPGASVLETVRNLARDYIGGYVVFDENAGTDGMWRMLQPKVAPYTPLARFYISHPGDGLIANDEDSYGTHTDGSQTVVHGFCRKGTFSRSVERAEGNVVTVIGGAITDSGSSPDGGLSRFSQVAYNVDSFNCFGLDGADPGYPDGTHADYIGRMVPIMVVDSTLTSQDAVDWVCRRTFDYACRARNHCRFQGPLVLVTDSTDTEQTNPRPLRVYDVVELEEYDGTFTEWIVADVEIDITKAHISLANYHLIQPSNMATKAVLPQGKAFADRLMRHAQRSTGQGAVWDSSKSRNSQMQTDNMMILHEPSGDPLQDLDNTSGTYGKFYFMPDFDPIE